MRTKALTLLVIFMSFIILPAIVNSLSNKINIIIAVPFAEEEEETHKNPSEIKKDYISDLNSIRLPNFSIFTKKAIITFQHKYNFEFSEIQLPPPELA
ncbi:MAG: hypothetical protein LC107_02355 [Chitinophagales bacterium]|nr:hypothetical protein [Chitinophagales bacterium]